MGLGGWLREAQLAVMLLTRLPAGHLPKPTPSLAVPSLASSVWAYPLAGLAVGAIAALVCAAGLALGLPAALAAGLALAAQVIVTGALHEDGLADVADGFWGGHDPARRLEIMRDSRIGSYGVVAQVLALGLRWQGIAALANVSPGAAAAGIVALAMSSRAACGLLMAWLPPARTDGMGHRAAGGHWPRVLAGVALGAGALAGLGLPVLPVLAVQAVLVIGLGRIAQAKIGGQTGDVLGSAQQLAEIGGWLVLAAVVG